MKKLLLFICFLAVGGVLFAQVPSQVVQLTFQVRIDDPTQLDTLPREEDGTSPTGKFFLIQNQIY